MIFLQHRKNYSDNCCCLFFILFIALVLNLTQVNAKTILKSSLKTSNTKTSILNDATETMPTSTTTAPQPHNRDITIGPCTWTIERKCPDKDITFYLYTRKNPSDRQYLHIDDSLDTSNLTNSFYESKHPSKIIIHGYNSDMFLHPLQMMKNEYLAKGDYNIFYVDWSKLAPAPCYISAVHNTRHVGQCIAKLVERVLDLGSSDIHAIGFSLGAQVTNYIAKNLETFQLPRITGLDPAMPLFAMASEHDKLDPSDAVYVDVIHTNAMVQGKLERCGHADFYMNGGIIQPGCTRINPLNPFACSHQRATAYFLESIRSPKGFWGWACSSYIAYLLGMCPETNYLVEAGENTKTTTKGMFLINTNDSAPFALGKWTDLPTLGIKKSPSASGTSMTFRPPPQKGDPLLRNIDEWAKLDYSFNNVYHQEPTPFSQDPYGENWSYFSEDTSDITNNSVEEQDVAEYHKKKQVRPVRTESERPQYVWDKYKINLTEGFIDNRIFRIPEVGRK